jgi:hypothetical protein
MSRSLWLGGCCLSGIHRKQPARRPPVRHAACSFMSPPAPTKGDLFCRLRLFLSFAQGQAPLLFLRAALRLFAALRICVPQALRSRSPGICMVFALSGPSLRFPLLRLRRPGTSLPSVPGASPSVAQLHDGPPSGSRRLLISFRRAPAFVRSARTCSTSLEDLADAEPALTFTARARLRFILKGTPPSIRCA